MNRIRVIFVPRHIVMKLDIQNHLSFSAINGSKIFEMPNTDSGKAFAQVLINNLVRDCRDIELKHSDFEFIETSI
jgi:hypothetical protein